MIPYILKTLQQEDHVFVERLGAFRTQLKHAVVEKNVIHPPYNEVVFSQDDSEENNLFPLNIDDTGYQVDNIFSNYGLFK